MKRKSNWPYSYQKDTWAGPTATWLMNLYWQRSMVWEDITQLKNAERKYQNNMTNLGNILNAAYSKRSKNWKNIEKSSKKKNKNFFDRFNASWRKKTKTQTSIAWQPTTLSVNVVESMEKAVTNILRKSSKSILTDTEILSNPIPLTLMEEFGQNNSLKGTEQFAFKISRSKLIKVLMMRNPQVRQPPTANKVGYNKSKMTKSWVNVNKSWEKKSREKWISSKIKRMTL